MAEAGPACEPLRDRGLAALLPAGRRGVCPRQHEKSPWLLRTRGFLFGAGERNRTLDLLITNELLYQLSYTGDRKKL